MAARYSALFICVLFCFSYVRGEEPKPVVETSQDVVQKPVLANGPFCILQPTCPRSEADVTQVTAAVVIPKLKVFEEYLIKSKDVLDHMYNRSTIPQQENLKIIVKSKSGHLASKLKEAATEFAEVVSVGEHTAAVKDAVLAAVPVLNDAAASLEHAGDDLIQQNAKYFEAASKLLQEVKKILDVELQPSNEVFFALKMALFQLQYDVDNYQRGVYNEMGFHKDDH